MTIPTDIELCLLYMTIILFHIQTQGFVYIPNHAAIIPAPKTVPIIFRAAPLGGDGVESVGGVGGVGVSGVAVGAGVPLSAPPVGATVLVAPGGMVSFVPLPPAEGAVYILCEWLINESQKVTYYVGIDELHLPGVVSSDSIASNSTVKSPLPPL